MLQAEHLKKSFGSLVAVDDVSFSVKAGESVGLLGPNGAGKTTTISMITGLLRPDSGKVLLGGKEILSDTDPIKQSLGLVPQELALYEELTAQENLEIFGALYGLTGAPLQKSIDAALEIVKLSERRRDIVKDFSGGMKRRINLAAALLHKPTLILLDEPTVGVDPQSRNAIFENILALQQSGMSIVYTTHYMEEAERLCQRIVIVDKGKVVADDTLLGLYHRLPAQNKLRIELPSPPKEVFLEKLKGLSTVVSIEKEEAVLRISLKSLDAIASVLSCFSEEQVTYSHLETERPSLEAVFLSLTGKSLRDE
jgi:ABC-2 type transport system ATP-binding protein